MVRRLGLASGRAHSHGEAVTVVLGLGDTDGLIEVVVIHARVHDLVALLGEVGRLDPARNRVPAVQEEDLHK